MSRIPWLKVEADGHHTLSLIRDMAEVGAFYNGQGWFRISRGDIPVRELLDKLGLAFEPGLPPADLLAIGMDLRMVRGG